MTNKSSHPNDAKKPAKESHPGMMGDGTEEQNLGQPGNPASRRTTLTPPLARKTPGNSGGCGWSASLSLGS
jgi:hypothetical protein